MSDLQIVDVHKSFGPNAVLRGIDLEVATGTFCSILGPSGSGKTTLLRIVAGFERADRGSLTLGKTILEDRLNVLPPARRRVGYVPQEVGLFPHLTVSANIGFGLPRRERHGKRVIELTEMVGLVGLERRYPHQLSGGQQQRVALARALAVRPELVLLDEPFSSLDASLRHSVRQDVRRVLAAAGTTVLMVTHDQDEALSLSTTVAVIEDGRIGQADAPANVYAHPGSPALARSLGQANLLVGVARSGRAETALGRLALERSVAEEGEPLLVLVRPEQLVLEPRRDGDPGAQVIAHEYYGHDGVVIVRTDWSPEETVTVRVSDATTLPKPGERVGLSVRGKVVAWPRADNLVLGGSDAAKH
jgi:iron(III) transport system ATP-binding protein